MQPGVFEAFGPRGRAIAEASARQLPQLVESDTGLAGRGQPESVLARASEALRQDLLSSGPDDGSSGTSACVVLLQGGQLALGTLGAYATPARLHRMACLSCAQLRLRNPCRKMHCCPGVL